MTIFTGEARTSHRFLRLPRNLGDAIFQGFTLLMAIVLLLLIVILVFELYMGSRAGIARFGSSFLVNQSWDRCSSILAHYRLSTVRCSLRC